jgi:hypothetical protein
MTLETQTKAVATYNAAADFYDDPAHAFWNHFGRRTVERLSLPRDARVLDVCCGSGASATHPLRSADDWWSMVPGGGYRGTIEQLGAEDQAGVRTACAVFIRETNVQCVETNVVYAIATRAS